MIITPAIRARGALRQAIVAKRRLGWKLSGRRLSDRLAEVVIKIPQEESG